MEHLQVSLEKSGSQEVFSNHQSWWAISDFWLLGSPLKHLWYFLLIGKTRWLPVADVHSVTLDPG